MNSSSDISQSLRLCTPSSTATLIVLLLFLSSTFGRFHARASEQSILDTDETLGGSATSSAPFRDDTDALPVANAEAGARVDVEILMNEVIDAVTGPVSKCVFERPILTSSGHTYEYANLVVLSQKCALTRERLDPNQNVYNTELCRLIDWIVESEHEDAIEDIQEWLSQHTPTLEGQEHERKNFALENAIQAIQTMLGSGLGKDHLRSLLYELMIQRDSTVAGERDLPGHAHAMPINDDAGGREPPIPDGDYVRRQERRQRSRVCAPCDRRAKISLVVLILLVLLGVLSYEFTRAFRFR